MLLIGDMMPVATFVSACDRSQNLAIALKVAIRLTVVRDVYS